jgi:hypothetical protein
VFRRAGPTISIQEVQNPLGLAPLLDVCGPLSATEFTQFCKRHNHTLLMVVLVVCDAPSVLISHEGIIADEPSLALNDSLLVFLAKCIASKFQSFSM